MKTKEVSKRLGVSDALIRQWASGPYREFLSAGAQVEGSTRFFTDHDVQVFTIAKQLSDQNRTRDEIAEHLADLQAAGWPKMPPIPPLPGPEGEEPRISLNEAQVALQRQRAEYESQVVILTGERDQLAKALESTTADRDRLQADYNSVNAELGTARGRLQEIDARLTEAHDQRRQWLRAAVVLGIVALAAVVILVAVLALQAGAG